MLTGPRMECSGRRGPRCSSTLSSRDGASLFPATDACVQRRRAEGQRSSQHNYRGSRCRPAAVSQTPLISRWKTPRLRCVAVGMSPCAHRVVSFETVTAVPTRVSRRPKQRLLILRLLVLTSCLGCGPFLKRWVILRRTFVGLFYQLPKLNSYAANKRRPTSIFYRLIIIF